MNWLRKYSDEIAAFLLSFSVFMAGADRATVPPLDASVRSAMAYHIHLTGQWYPPYLNGNIFVDHPPLYIWLQAISYKIFGVSDYAAMFPGRFFSFGLSLLLFVFARMLGLSSRFALFSVFIFCTTRDFILCSAKGGIEPVFCAFALAGFVLILAGIKKYHAFILPILAGICLFFTAFSKGPPALWPILCCAFLPFLVGMQTRQALKRGAWFFASFFLCSFAWLAWLKASGNDSYWQRYITEMILESAFKGRGGVQPVDYTYFIRILFKRYWPWLPALLLSIVMLFRSDGSKPLRRSAVICFLIAAGYVAGFSIVRWKFWYYIVPAYSFFAVGIAAAAECQQAALAKWLKPVTALSTPIVVSILAITWMLINASVPISLSDSRQNDVRSFAAFVKGSPVEGPVWFVRHPGDHNMYGSHGTWYFHRPVLKVVDESEWSRSLPSQALILTGSSEFQVCKETWCERSLLLMSDGPSALVLYRSLQTTR